MFSGSDTIDYPTQWALNPSAYQNMSNDQVDWGALAQQWIHMKETCPAQPVPPAPPPPPPIAAIPSSAGIEGGEAPMEMEGEMEAPPAPSVSQQQWTNASSNPPTGNWDNQSWDSWGNWGWQQNSEPVTKQPLLPEPTYSGYSTGESNFSGYSGGGQSSGTYGSSGYWSGDRGLDGGNRSVRPPHPPPPSSRHQQMPRRNQRPPLLAHPQQELVEAPDTTQTIDAAKRRQLPAWIREGLEKMEREKQKQMDRERERKERDEYLRLKKIEDEMALKNAQPDDGIPRPPAKSKFDSDSEDSETEVKVKVKVENVDRETKEVLAPPPLLKRSEEEIMQDVMLCVRRTLTEILLDVTTEQILSICQEEVARIRSQTQASRGASLAGKSQALSAIGGQLGLGIYGDSSGDSESETDSTGRSTPGGKKRSSSHDVTDGQLQENIRRRKSEFEKTSREIEARLVAEEEALLRKSSVGRSKVGNPVPTHGDGDSSGSDGEDTPSENRNEPSVATQRDPRDRTPPVEYHDKSKRSNTESKIRHSTEKKDKNDASKAKSSGKKSSRREVKKGEKSSRDKKRHDERNKSNSSSTSSDSSASSESESVNNKSDDSESKRSNSVASVSSESSSSSSSRSSSSPPRKKGSKKKKKRTSSNDSSKRDRKNSRKSKSNNGKKAKSSKNAEKVYSKFDLDEDTTQSSSKRPRDYYEHKSERSLRDSQFSSRDSYARTPDRKVSAKSRYNERSRSRSLDRASSRYESKKYSSYRTEERSRDKSREDRGRSREYRDRSRDRRGDSRDRRGRSRNRDDRRDGGRREGRSYRY